MSEEQEEAGIIAGAIPPAAVIAIGAGKDIDPRAAALIEKQTRLTDLQIGDLEREDKVRHWSLRVRHISDVMKLAFEFAAGFIVLTGATFLGVAIWTAAHDKSLIIDAFDVPPDLAARGLSGQVIAARIEDRLSWMQANTITSRPASTYLHDWGRDIKVQIPETGISVGEAYRYLVSWLGDQTHITGAIWRTPNGIALVTRAGSDAAPTINGPEADLDSIILKAAEQIYRQTQTYRYISFLNAEHRIPEELVAARTLALNGAPEEKPWAYTRWGVTLENLGDLRGALDKQRIATELGPELPHTWYNLASAEAALGHDEAALRDNNKALTLLKSSAARQLAPFAVAADIPIIGMVVAEETGDFREAVAQASLVEAAADYGASHRSAEIMRIADLASDHDVSASRNADSRSPDAERESLQLGSNGNFELQPLPSFLRDAAMENWRAARDDLVADNDSKSVQDPALKPMLPVLTWPWLAYAQARLGNFIAAHALIDKTPLDCDLCLRMRGNIDAAEHNWTGANYWFTAAVARAPSLPFAFSDWGKMLLQKGDLDGAIAKFETANERGPHFADPLEMWGEALMRQNRSDLALDEFADADKYAPKWGRLHLKWGEALSYAGQVNDARKQFAAAASLDLTPAETAELARAEGAHG